MILDVINTPNPPPEGASPALSRSPGYFGPEYCMPPAVLLVADNTKAHAFRQLRKVIGQHYRVLATCGLDQTAALALRTAPDAIVIDAARENTCGLGAFKDLQTHPDTRRIPVLAVAAARQKQSGLTVLSAGANDILFRPFVSGELVLRLSQLLALSETQKQLLEAIRQLHATEDKLRDSTESAALGILTSSLLQEVSQPLARLAQALPEMQTFATSLPQERSADFISRVTVLQQHLALARELIRNARLLDHRVPGPADPFRSPAHGPRFRR